MNDSAKTGVFLGAAALLVVLAMMTGPSEVQPEQFSDQGEAFFEKFVDPTAATELEVWSFNPESTEIRVFKVAKDDRGVWTIPSHGGYPADAKDQMAKSAGMLVGLTKRAVVSDSKADHKAFGVVDPTEESLETEGRGVKVLFRDKAESTLGELIIGNEREGKADEYYVRVPDKKRTYIAKIDNEVSTKFEDWIETDLLKAKSWEIDKMVFDNYSIDEQQGRIVEGEKLTVAKDDSSQWVLDGLADGKETDAAKVGEVATALTQIKIVGVRSKPPGLTARLETAGGIDRMILEQNLQSKGYFILRDGSMRSNEGDLVFETTKGIRYTLRFGEIAYGDGEAVTAGGGDNKPAEGVEAQASNRFLMVSAEFDKALLDAPSGFRMLDDEWDKRVTARKAIEEIVAAVDAYRAANDNRMPESLAALTQPVGEAEPLLEQLDKDPWEQDYVLEPMGETFAVVSYGADKKSGGDGIEKDIRNDAFADEDEISRVRGEWDAFDTKVEEGQKEAKDLARRFGPWYYVISEELFGKLKPTSEGLSKDKAAEEGGPEGGNK